MGKRVVVALGGNAILQPGQKGTAGEQWANVQLTCHQIARMIQAGYEVVITHGNGPQVGNILIQNEEGANMVPPMPLDICGAESQGLIGYMIQQALTNELQGLGIDKAAVTVVTQVEVDPADPDFQNPSKPVGPFYTAEKAKELMAEKGWLMKEAGPKGWRRVVPSPQPKMIREKKVIRDLLAAGNIVIASGGGGIPVRIRPDGRLEGVEAVIDKDRAGQRLAADVGADIFLILTDVARVAINFNTPQQQDLTRLTLAEARQYQAEGHFRAGSMGPKVEAAVCFVEEGGELAVITSLDTALEALTGDAGTKIVH